MKRVFVIHGRQKLGDMHEFLKSIGLDPIPWDEGRKSTGKPNPYTWDTVVELVEMADLIVGMLTPDDEARLRSALHGQHEQDADKRLMGQARPNVLIEIGYAMGRKGNKVVLVQVGAHHRPLSDLWGHHIPLLNNQVKSREVFLDALDAALDGDCTVDRSNDSWHQIGDFGMDEDHEPLAPSPFQGAYQGSWRISNYRQAHDKLLAHCTRMGLPVNASLLPPESGKTNFMITSDGWVTGQLIHGGMLGLIRGTFATDGQFAGTATYLGQPSTPVQGNACFDSHGRLKCDVFQRIQVPQIELEIAYSISALLEKT